VKTRQAQASIKVGAIFRVSVVGVLLLAVVWQLAGLTQPSRDESVAPPTMADEQTADQGITETFLTTDDVNLRRGPGTDHDVITVVPMHAEVLVTGESLNGFAPVQVGGTSAWLAESYLVPEGELAAETNEETTASELPVDPDAAIDQPVIAANVDVGIVEPVSGEPATEPDAQPMGVSVVSAAEIQVEEPVALTGQTSVEPVEDVVVEEPGERWADVNRTTRTVTLHEGDRIVAQFPALIGKDPSADGYYSTAIGTFYVHTMTRELAETPFAEGVYLTHFVGFDAARSNGFHSPTRDADGNVIQTGGTATLGCVRLSEADAIRMFDFAFIGMRVEVHD
jgi:hypothetical protein